MACLQGHDPHVATARATHTQREREIERGESDGGKKGTHTSHIRPVYRCTRPALFMALAFGLPFDFAAEIETGTGTETETVTTALPLLSPSPSPPCPSICPSSCLSACLSLGLSVRLSVCSSLAVCLAVKQSSHKIEFYMAEKCKSCRTAGLWAGEGRCGMREWHLASRRRWQLRPSLLIMNNVWCRNGQKMSDRYTPVQDCHVLYQAQVEGVLGGSYVCLCPSHKMKHVLQAEAQLQRTGLSRTSYIAARGFWKPKIESFFL